MLRGRVVGVCWVAVSILAICAGTVLAQPQRGQQRGGEGGGQPQRGGGFGGAMQGFGGGMGMGMMAELTLVRRSDVQDELGLTDDQVEELTQLRPNVDMRAIMGEMRDLDEQQRADRIRELMESGQKEMQEQIDTILLPNQSSRLKQLAVQWQLAQPQRAGGGLAGGDIATKIGISDAQREKLQEKARQLEQEFRKKLQEELTKELTPQQQSKIKELVGEPFEFQQEEPRGPQRRGDAPAGAGGAGAGRRGRGN